MSRSSQGIYISTLSRRERRRRRRGRPLNGLLLAAVGSAVIALAIIAGVAPGLT